MARTTIDYGIDLGTTNSSIALLVDTTPEVIQNKDGSLLTPSAIWFNERGTQHVGKEAKARFIDDDYNAAVEFKLQMGKNWRKTFERSGKQMLPEEMSAEILKSLRDDVYTAKREDLGAAVITVPAAFELPQCDATRRAAELAGLTVSPLLQEPVAAALAYGFQSTSDKVFWMVYDFGGGTFDAAIIQVRDGVIQVVNHAGDNRLGGKNIDWDIVEKLLIPRIKKEYKLSDFPDNRSTHDLRWRSALAKLKSGAETAKMQVSRTRKASEIYIDNLCTDDDGNTVDFVYELTPSVLESVTVPWVEKSVRLCRKALDEKGLVGRDIERVLLVGGSSLFPWLHDRISSEFGIPLEFRIDPLTVVARGAAVFAGSQRLAVPTGPVDKGIYTIQLEYDPIGSDIEPLIGGKVTPPSGRSLDALRVEIVELRSEWRSGSIALAADGTFVTGVRAEKGRKCEYEIVLSDATGRRLSCTPDRFAYTVGMVITSPPLTDNLGVAQDGNVSDWFFYKGDPLPVRCRKVYYTTVALRRNKPYHRTDNVIRIPLIEGHNGKADRNRQVSALEIKPDDPRVKRDVPLGAEVEVTIGLDASRSSTIEAFIPILDETFVRNCHLLTEMRHTPEELERQLASELHRLRGLGQRASETADARANAVLDQIEREQIIETVQSQVAAAQGDPEAQDEADRRLLDLKATVDSVEDALRWPSLVREAHEQARATRELVEAHGEGSEMDRLKELEDGVERAIDEERVQLLMARLEDLRELGAAIIVRQPDFWVGYLQYLEERREHMQDRAAAEMLFTQAQRAIASCDLESLRAAVQQLIRLLPPEEREAAEARGGFGGTIISG